jgi:sec-independent protein translocase protein TatC
VIDEPAPITEHLAELRTRLFWILATTVVFSVVAFNFAEEIFLFLMLPAVEALGEQGARLQAIAPTETFFTYLKCALLAGFVCSLPVTFWQLWAFVAPGLYDNERRAILPFVVISTGLFVGGAVFGYTQVFPLVFEFLSGWSSDLVEQAWTMREAFSVTTRLFLAFGIAFEMPVFVFFLALTGIVSAEKLLRGTPYAVLAIFIVAAILTPPDFVSQILLAIPMLALYLIGVGVAFLFDPRRRERREQSVQSSQAE